MRYIDILAKLLDMFPVYVDNISSWSPAGDNRIRVETKDMRAFEFTYFGDSYWMLCTAGYGHTRGERSH